MYAVNGPSSSNGKPVPAQGFIIDMKGSGEIVSIFGSKASTHMGTPHAIALGPNGSSIYIADISPYRVLKFIREGSENIYYKNLFLLTFLTCAFDLSYRRSSWNFFEWHQDESNPHIKIAF